MIRFPAYTEMLVLKRVMSQDELERAKGVSEQSGRELELVLIEDRFIFKEQLLKLKADFYGCSFVDLKTIKIDTNAAATMPQSMSERYRLLCLNIDKNRLQAVMADPHDRFAREYVRMRTGFELEARVGYWGDIKSAIEMVFEIPMVQKQAAREEVQASAAKAAPKEAAPPSENLGFFTSWTAKEKSLKSALKSAKNEWETLSIITNITKDLSSYLDKRALIPKILEVALHIFDVEGISLILMSGGSPQLYFKHVLGKKASDMENLVIPLDEKSVAGWIALNRQPLLINDVKNDYRHSSKVDEMTKFQTRSILGAPVIFANDVLGVIEAVNKKDGNFKKRELDYLMILASNAAIALKNAEVFDRLRNFSMEAVELLIELLEYINKDLKGHLVEVARIATSMGELLSLDRGSLENLCYASLLHDIGMIRGDGLEEHPVRSAEILHHIKLFEGLLPLVMYHHERFDGSGFPFKLEGEKIPLGAQILGVAEAYVEGAAKARSEERFLRTFLKKFGEGFNPRLKDAFEKAVAGNRCDTQ